MSGTLNKIISLISYEISMVESYFVKEKNQPLPWTSTIHALLVHERLGHDQMGRETETLSLSLSQLDTKVCGRKIIIPNGRNHHQANFIFFVICTLIIYI